MDEKTIIELPLWEEYLIYATAFGIADKVIKALEMRNIDFSNSELLSNPYCRSHAIGTCGRTIYRSTWHSSGASGGFFGGGHYGGGGVGQLPGEYHCGHRLLLHPLQCPLDPGRGHHHQKFRVLPGLPGVRRVGRPDHHDPHPAQLGIPDHRQHHPGPGHGDPDCLLPVLPGTGRSAAQSGMGRHVVHRPGRDPQRPLCGADPRRHHHAGGAQLQPGGRRPAGCPGSQAAE